MIRKLTLFSVCAFEIALIFFAGIQSVSSNTFEPFENGVGILCKTIESKDNQEPLFFLFAEDRQSVSRLRFEKNHIRLSETLRTEISANSISWLVPRVICIKTVGLSLKGQSRNDDNSCTLSHIPSAGRRRQSDASRGSAPAR